MESSISLITNLKFYYLNSDIERIVTNQFNLYYVVFHSNYITSLSLLFKAKYIHE